MSKKKKALVVSGYEIRVAGGRIVWSPWARAVCNYVASAHKLYDALWLVGGRDHPSMSGLIAEVERDYFIDRHVPQEKVLVLSAQYPEKLAPRDSAEEAVLVKYHLDQIGEERAQYDIVVAIASPWRARTSRAYRSLAVSETFVSIPVRVPLGLRCKLLVADIFSYADPLGESNLCGAFFRINRKKRKKPGDSGAPLIP